MKNSTRLFAALFIALACSVVALAQTNRGGISGTVFDKNGAVVPDATVTITNVGTNRSQQVKTSSDGAYTAPSLEPVVYRIAVEAAGFKKAVVDNVKVDTATTASVNVTLEAGATTAEVTITAEAPLLNAESGTSGQTISERQITDLPLNNRSVLDLVLTAGNVSGVAGTGAGKLFEIS